MKREREKEKEREKMKERKKSLLLKDTKSEYTNMTELNPI